MSFKLIDTGDSASFPRDDAFRGAARESGSLVIIGKRVHEAFCALSAREKEEAPAILLELDVECLGVHAGEAMGDEGGKVLGFSRFRLGAEDPSALVEVVRQPHSADSALRAAKDLFGESGLAVAFCGDAPGRILNRLIRPYLNAALARLDDGLAPASQIDLALRLGLGYPKGPFELLRESGLAEHFRASKALHASLGTPEFFPARRAQVAAAFLSLSKEEQS